MIERGTRLFDSLIVALGTNPEKDNTFTADERLVMLEEIARDMPVNNLEVAVFHNLYLVEYARSVGAEYMLRGIRTSTDFEFERVMRHVNEDLSPHITTVFLMPPRAYAEVSSSLVKGLVGPTGWQKTVRQFVPEGVFRALCQKFGEDSRKEP